MPPLAQTHTIVRQLQLLLPGIRIWLDVDNLDDVGKLEEAVQESVVFIVFLSKGYFRSANCRRELYAALAGGKPFVAIHEADAAKVRTAGAWTHSPGMDALTLLFT